MPLAHQEDTESQQGREAGLPAEESKQEAVIVVIRFYSLISCS